MRRYPARMVFGAALMDETHSEPALICSPPNTFTPKASADSTNHDHCDWSLDLSYEP